MVSTKVVKKAARVVSRVVVAVGVPNSRIKTQTVVEVYGTTSKTIRGTINDSLFEKCLLRDHTKIDHFDQRCPI